jgi:hypothetical protein
MQWTKKRNFQMIMAQKPREGYSLDKGTVSPHGLPSRSPLETVTLAGLLWSNTRGMEEELKDDIAKVALENLERLERCEEFRMIPLGDGVHRLAERVFAKDLPVAARGSRRCRLMG